MTNRPPAKPDADLLPESVATHVLTRASELDATLATSSSVLDLRKAATEAGISARAFDTALAEVQSAAANGRTSAGPTPTRFAQRWVLGAVAAAVLAVGAYNAMRNSPNTSADASPTTPTVEEAVFLQCLPGGEALELVRPLLADRSSRATWNPSLAPRVIVLRSSPEQLQRAKALLAQHDAAGTQTCRTPAR